MNIKIRDISKVYLTITLSLLSVLHFSASKSDGYKLGFSQNTVKAMEDESCVNYKFKYTGKESVFDIDSFFRNNFFDYISINKDGKVEFYVYPHKEFTCYEEVDDLVLQFQVSDVIKEFNDDSRYRCLEGKFGKLFGKLFDKSFCRSLDLEKILTAKNDDEIKKYSKGNILSVSSLEDRLVDELKFIVSFDKYSNKFEQAVGNTIYASKALKAELELTEKFNLLNETEESIKGNDSKENVFMGIYNDVENWLTVTNEVAVCADDLEKCAEKIMNDVDKTKKAKEVEEEYVNKLCSSVPKLVRWSRQWCSFFDLIKYITDKKFPNLVAKYCKINEQIKRDGNSISFNMPNMPKNVVKAYGGGDDINLEYNKFIEKNGINSKLCDDKETIIVNFPWTGKTAKYKKSSFFDQKFFQCENGNNVGFERLPNVKFTCYFNDDEWVTESCIKNIKKEFDEKYGKIIENEKKLDKAKNDNEIIKLTKGILISKNEWEFVKNFYNFLPNVVPEIEDIKYLFSNLDKSEGKLSLNRFKILTKSGQDILKDTSSDLEECFIETYADIERSSNCAHRLAESVYKLAVRSDNFKKLPRCFKKFNFSRKYISDAINYYMQWYYMAMLVKNIVNIKFPDLVCRYKKRIKEEEENNKQKRYATQSLYAKKAVENERLKRNDTYGSVVSFRAEGDGSLKLSFSWSKSKPLCFNADDFFGSKVFDDELNEKIFYEKSGILSQKFTTCETNFSYSYIKRVYEKLCEGAFSIFDNMTKEDIKEFDLLPLFNFRSVFKDVLSCDEDLNSRNQFSIFACAKKYVNMLKILRKSPKSINADEKAEINGLHNSIGILVDDLIRKNSFVDYCSRSDACVDYVDSLLVLSVYVKQWLEVFTVALFSIEKKFGSILDKPLLLKNTNNINTNNINTNNINTNNINTNNISTNNISTNNISTNNINTNNNDDKSYDDGDFVEICDKYDELNNECSFVVELDNPFKKEPGKIFGVKADLSVFGREYGENECCLLNDSLIKEVSGNILNNEPFVKQYEKVLSIIDCTLKAIKSSKDDELKKIGVLLAFIDNNEYVEFLKCLDKKLLDIGKRLDYAFLGYAEISRDCNKRVEFYGNYIAPLENDVSDLLNNLDSLRSQMECYYINVSCVRSEKVKFGLISNFKDINTEEKAMMCIDDFLKNLIVRLKAVKSVINGKFCGVKIECGVSEMEPIYGKIINSMEGK